MPLNTGHDDAEEVDKRVVDLKVKGREADWAWKETAMYRCIKLGYDLGVYLGINTALGRRRCVGRGRQRCGIPN